MARKQYDLLVGLFALAAIVVLAYMTILFSGGVAKYRDSIKVVGVFSQAGGLIEKAPVYFSGVEIGLVEKIEVATTGKIHVTMRVARQAKLRQTDVPEIVQRGVLGDVVINFIRGEEPGALARDNTLFEGKDPVDIVKKAEELIAILTSEETVNSFRRIRNNIEDITTQLRKDIETLRDLFNTDFLDDIRATVSHTRTASADLPVLVQEATDFVRETRADSTQILRSFAENTQRLERILASLDEILAVTARGEGTIGSLVQDPRLYEAMVSTMEALRESVVAIKNNLPFGISKRIQAKEEAAAAAKAERDKIWRR